MNREEKERRKEEEGAETSIWDCGSPLYDSFEVASLMHELDRKLMLLPFSWGSGKLTARATLDKQNDEQRMKMKIMKKKKTRKSGLQLIDKAMAFWRKELSS